ncbi:hypothetical protein EMCRGX_G010495 [Ephydatia muelleri]
MGPKLSQHNLGLCHISHGRKDGLRRTPKHVADPAAYKDIYFVEDIIAERMTKKRKEWLVRWKRFSHEDDTWEPLEHLSGCEQYIARFEEERDRKQAEDDDARGQKRKRRNDDETNWEGVLTMGVAVEAKLDDSKGRSVQGRDANEMEVEDMDVDGTDVDGMDVDGTDVDGTDVDGTDVDGTDVDGKRERTEV